MVPYTVSRCSAIYSIIVLYAFGVTCHALVIGTPTLVGSGMLTTKENRRAETKIERLDLDLRIRSTNEGDIKEIAHMLTRALLEEEDLRSDATERNRRQRILPLNLRFRNTRAGVTPLLESRMNAIKIGNKTMNQHFSQGIVEKLTEAEQLRLLWSNDSFRNSVEKAASLSNEPHVWKEHNFACAPQSFNRLFHKMITAENAFTGEIVGFCEVAMLSQPSVDKSSETGTYETGSLFFDEECSIMDEESGVPTIVNLVTSVEYRRRGVGSAVMKSAMNYLKKVSSSSDTMALYVDESNDSAIRIYECLGFQKIRRVESKNQWYMVRQISSDAVEKQSKRTIKAFQ